MDGTDGLPDELPLSQASVSSAPEHCIAELPDELPLSQASDGGIGALREPVDLPDQLPLSSDDEMGPAPGGRDPMVVCNPDPPDIEHPAKEMSIRAMKGRPDRPLLSALSDAEAALQRQRQGMVHPVVPGGPIPLGDDQAPVETQDDMALAARMPGAWEGSVPQHVDGYNLESPLGPALSAAQRASRQGHRDPEALAIAHELLQEEVAAVASKRVLYEKLDIDASKVDTITPRLACALHLQELAFRRNLEELIARTFPARDQAMYLEACTYDETPLTVAVKEERSAWQRDNRAQAALPGPAGELASREDRLILAGKGQAFKLTSSSSAQKILQHRQVAAYLLRCREGYLLVKSPRTLTPLVILESGTSEVLATALRRLSAGTRAVSTFGQKVRGICTDQASANIAAERGMQAERRDSRTTIHNLCNVHKTALVHSKTFALVKSGIKGMIATALSLRAPSAMSKFRRAMREEIMSRLQILHGKPSREAMQHKRAVLTLFCAHGRNLAVKKVLLLLCPNGDWRSEQVQFFLPLGARAPPREAVAEFLCTGVVTALCANHPGIYPHHRWTGADLACDDLGLIESVHCLLSGTYIRFLVLFQQSLAGKTLAQCALGSAIRDTAHMLMLEDGGGAGNLEGQSSSGQADDPAAPASIEAGSDESPAAAMARINAANRRAAARWLSQSPLADLVLIRLTMEPLRQLLTEQLKVAGDVWEVGQQCRAAQAMAEGRTGVSIRDFRLVLVAKGHFDAKLKGQVAMLWTERHLWATVPEAKYTIAFRSLAFRCIARMSCASMQVLEHQSLCFPTRLFVLLGHPELAPTFDTVPDCVLDSWSLQMRRLHPGFVGEEFQAKLLLCAMVLEGDVSTIEARHASIRRLLIASSQTNPVEHGHLSAQWLCMQARTRLREMERYAATAIGRKRKAREALRERRIARQKRQRPPARTPHHSGGGAWRAFARLKLLGIRGRPDFTELGRVYRAERAANTPDYQRAVNMAMAAKRCVKWKIKLPGPTFGANSKRSQSRVMQEFRHAVWSKSIGLDDDERMLAVADRVAELRMGARESISMVRAIHKYDAQQLELQRKQAFAALEEWRQGPGAAIVQAVANSHPAMGALSLVPEPCGPYSVVSASPQELSPVGEALAWAHGTKSTTLSSCLEKQWRALHLPVLDGDCQPLPASAARSKCAELGMCICSGANKRIAAIMDTFLDSMKRLFRANTVHRDFLLEGKIVAKFSSEPDTDDYEAILTLGDAFPNNGSRWACNT